MNIFNSFFLLLGKGITYQNCSSFFKDNKIKFDAINTGDVINSSENLLITKNKEYSFDEIDYVVISPGIGPENTVVKLLKDNSVKIITDIEIIQSISTTKCICVTGTNGKTSTVELLSYIINDNDMKALACGNNGVSVFDSLKQDYDYLIIELSSYQLEYINYLKSYISVLLNVSEDHLERHDNISNYLKIKSKIFNDSNFCIINKDIAFHKNNLLTFGLSDNRLCIDGINEGILFDSKKLSYKKKCYPIKGRFQALNISACLAVCSILRIPVDRVLDILNKKIILQHRQEVINEKNGIKFINDSKSTNLESTIAALESIDERIILIMGGSKKIMPYENMTEIINQKVKKLILIGDNKNYISDKLIKCKKKIILNNLKEAFDYAISIAIKNDVILLSPGSPSFDMYDNFEQRGNHFKSLVKTYVSK